jgi:hypothetical protein
MCEDYKCLRWTLVGMFTIKLSFITIPTVYLPLGKILDSDEINCYIYKIDYPTEPPEINLDNWKSCSCGKNCSSYKPCVTLYSNFSRNKKIKQNLYDNFYDCTFLYDKKCGETDNYINYISESIDVYHEYINQNVDCYYYEPGGELYLDNSLKILHLVFASIFVCILLVVCCLLIEFSEACCCCICIAYGIMKLYKFITSARIFNSNNVIDKNYSKNKIAFVEVPLEIFNLDKKERKNECVICLDSYEKDKKVIQLSCNHIIHESCWNKWKEQNASCPMCRTKQN